MAEAWRYRGQEIDSEQIAFLRKFIREHPTSSRWKLSRQLCEALGWKQANGALRDVVCRGLLLMLERAGEIELPPVRRLIVGQRRTARPRPEAILIDTTPLTMPLRALGAIEIELVRRTADEPLFQSLMEGFHYLRYEQPVGEHLKFLPWVEVPHLASHILGRMPRRISQDWERLYGHPIYYLETFIDPERFRGTCYRAANWMVLGRTTGRGKDDQTHRPNRSIKEVLGLPLHRRFRELLGDGK